MRIGRLGALLAVGCAKGLSADEGAGPLAPPAAEEPAATDADSGSPPPSSEDSPESAYYALDLSFALLGGTRRLPGEWQIETASLAIDLRSRAQEHLCTHEVPIVGVASESPPEDQPELVAWWRLSLAEGAPDGPCASWPERVWRLGFGAYDPRLDPMMAERGSLGFDVYGLYLQEEPEGPVYVLGLAGTNEMLLGQPDLTVDVVPLPDGGYRAESLVLMSLD